MKHDFDDDMVLTIMIMIIKVMMRVMMLAMMMLTMLMVTMMVMAAMLMMMDINGLSMVVTWYSYGGPMGFLGTPPNPPGRNAENLICLQDALWAYPTRTKKSRSIKKP